MLSGTGQSLFLMLAADWHYGISAYPFSDAEAAVAAARHLAWERAERPQDLSASVPPGTLLCLHYAPDGEAMVWVVERVVDGPVVEPVGDCT